MASQPIEMPADELPDAYLLLGAIKLHLANRKPGSKWPLMTWGDELAWIICDEKQRGVSCG